MLANLVVSGYVDLDLEKKKKKKSAQEKIILMAFAEKEMC